MEQVAQKDREEKMDTFHSKRRKLTVGDWWREHYVYIVSSLMIVTAIMIVLSAKRFWPFGKTVLLDGDFAMQSWPFLVELKRKLASGDSLLYTWNVGYGTNYYTIFTSIINPLTILYLLLPTETIMPFSSIAFILLEVAMNCSMLYFLTHRPLHRLKQNQMSNMMFSLSYALCMYAVSNINNWHMMISAVYFPLILLGLERFVVNRDWKLYYIMLSVSFLCGYYMTALFCIFIILYYLTLEFGSFQIFWKKSVKIFGISLGSALTAAVVLIPSFYQLFQQSYTISDYAGDSFFTTFFDTIKNFLALNTAIERGTTSYSYGEVNLYYGLFLLMLSSFYFINPKIKRNVRIRKLAVVIIYLMAFNINSLNYVMHLFHYPSWFPNRFSLNFTLLCIILAYDAWVSMKETEFRYATVWRGVAVGVGWFLITLLCFAFSEEVKYQFTYSYSIMLFMVYMVGMLLLPYFRKKFPNILAGLACIEICLCFMFALIFKRSNVNILPFSEAYSEKVNFFNEHPLEEEHGFSRMIDSGSLIRVNEGMLFGNKGTSIFSSSIGNIGDFLECAGVAVGGNYIFPYTYNQATASLMNIQYIYDDCELSGFTMPESLYTSRNSTFDAFPIYAREDSIILYENPTVLSLGYMIDEKADTVFSEDLEDYSENHLYYEGINDWVNGICGVTDAMTEGALKLQGVQADNCRIIVRNNGIMLSKDTGTEMDEEYTEFLKDDDVFYDITMQEYDSEKDSLVCLEYMAEEEGEYLIQVADQIVSTGYLEKGEQFYLYCIMEHENFDVYSNISSGIYVKRLNEKQWQQAYDVLSQQQLDVSAYSSTAVDGTIQVKEDGILFTSIPYDENWHMYVDGEEVEILPLWSDSFVSTRLSAGEHTIHLEYRQSGLVLGEIISCISVIGIVVYIILGRRKQRDFLLEPAETINISVSDFYTDSILQTREEQKKAKRNNKEDAND